ncbi:MAG: response regulator [Fuerstiella sp.]|nr:response regulator [Fuerstiella sp.]
MAKILVVDDSAFDRRLTTSILENSSSYSVVNASDGKEAVKLLEAGGVDLVISDLNMPDMNGLELVQEIHKSHADLPTIVITGFGSEATAMRALQAGACGYVPKCHLQEELGDVVQTVLSTTARQREKNDFMCSVVKQMLTLEIPNERHRIAPTIAILQKQMDAMKLFDGSRTMHLGVALEEALSNAIIHGNLEVSSKLRERDDNAYGDLIIERGRTAPYADRRVTIEAHMDAESARFTIRDEGPGFDISKLPDPHCPDNLLRSSGRGLTLMHAFLDEVSYNDKGNEVTLRLNAGEVQAPEDSVANNDSKVMNPVVGEPKYHNRLCPAEDTNRCGSVVPGPSRVPGITRT